MDIMVERDNDKDCLIFVLWLWNIMSKIASARRTSKNLILETVDNYERIAKIGEGSFSIVWRGTLRDGVVEHPWVIKDVALAKMR